jgi:outer membrane protein insertion porin family
VPGAPEQVDLTITVTEKPTGNLLIGAGFSSAERLSLVLNIKQENVFGSGNYLGLEINTSKYNRQIVLSTVDPYFTRDGISRSIDFYSRATRPYADQGGDYRLLTTGGSLRFGVPFTELDTVYLGGGFEQTKIEPGTNIPAAYLDYATRFGYTSSSFPLTVGWSRDNRDSALVPSKGSFQRLNGDTGVGGEVRYVRANYQYQQYVPLNKQFTLAINGELGWGKGLGGRPFPIFKSFYSGGLGTVRGFEQSTLGPRDVTGSFIGGAKKINLNAELLAPFPGAGNDKTLRIYTFVDAGNVYGEKETYSIKDLRSSFGVGLSWISPIGPLRLAIANPIRKQPGDRIQKLQFQIGTSF